MVRKPCRGVFLDGNSRLSVRYDFDERNTLSDSIDQVRQAVEGRYDLVRELGAGGMATVYLARDLRHERNVAIKVLRPELSALLGSERFLTEIRVTANLHHPHILPLHDSGAVEGLLYYVMPFVEGESLRERLNREKQLSIEESLTIAKAVASALDYAHRHDVIHRDIKPENILLHDEQALVADFGIALALTQAGGTRLTETGLSIGTPSYMSPEQATGEREVTMRSDIFSLGCVLYEMLTGEPPHTGPTAQAIIAKVLTSHARPVREMRETVPDHVDCALNKALAKLAADRFATAAAFGEAITPVAAPDQRLQVVNARKDGRPTWPRFLMEFTPPRWMIATSFIVLLGLVGYLRLTGDPEPTPEVVRFTVPVTGGHQMLAGMVPRLAVSHDGRTLVYGSEGRLYSRPIDQVGARPMSGTAGAESPFFSQDDQWVGFVRGERLWKVPLAGGPAIPIAEAPTNFGAVWDENGDIIFAPAIGDGGLLRVSAEGGSVVALTTIAADASETSHAWPDALPGGKLVMFTVLGPSYGWDEARIDIQDITTGERWTAVDGGAFGRYVTPGYIIYVQPTGVVLAVPYDVRRRTATGPAIPVLSGVRLAGGAGAASLVVSDEGTMAFVRGSTAEMYTLNWVDRTGTILAQMGQPINAFSQFEIAPDGRKVAITVRHATNIDVWVADAVDGQRERLTFELPENESPLWSPDGRRIAYSSAGPGQTRHIYLKDASGAGEPTLVHTGTRHLHLTSWSPDGRWLAFYEYHPERQADLWALDLDSAEHLMPLAVTDAMEQNAVFSRDGNWLAYQSDESGVAQVYVVSFPDIEGKRQISTERGSLPHWSHATDELFYRGSGGLMAVDVSTTGSFSRGVPRVLFEPPNFERYDVAPDGQRFLLSIANSASAANEIEVVLNFFEALDVN